MKITHSFQSLIAIIAISVLAVTAVAIVTLYDTAFAQHRLRLIESVKSQARLIESIARFNTEHSRNEHNGGWHGDDFDNWQSASINQVANAHRQFEGFGETGEFTMARKENSKIIFVLSHRHFDLETPRPIPIEGKWAEPMRRALTGESGTIVGLDYRGTRVLAAYEPLEVLNLGLVAKIDLTEIRTPFFRAGIFSLGVALIIILFSSTLFIRITRPISKKIEQQEETFRALTETAHEGIFLIDTNGIIQYMNPAAETLFGYSPNELKGENVSRLMPTHHREKHDHYLQRYLDTGIKTIIDSGRQLTAVKKDGTHLPIYLSVGEIKLSHTHLFTGVILDLSEQRQLQRELLAVPLREQQRVGQELHDGLGQQLTGLGMLATSLLNKASKPDYALAEQLATGLQEAIVQVRALSHGLIPVQIDAEGFTNALVNLTQEIEKCSGIPIKLQIDEKTPISDNTTALHLFRIAQEALNNAIKHAGARQIVVTLTVERDHGLIVVADDGSGLPKALDDSSGLGLRIMKHRCGLFEGEIIIDSRDGGGTQVRCRFPIDSESIE